MCKKKKKKKIFVSISKKRRTPRDAGSRHFVHPYLVLIVLRIERDLSSGHNRVGGIVLGRGREGLILTVALLCARGFPACPADQVVAHRIVVHTCARRPAVSQTDVLCGDLR